MMSKCRIQREKLSVFISHKYTCTVHVHVLAPHHPHPLTPSPPSPPHTGTHGEVGLIDGGEDPADGPVSPAHQHLAVVVW